MVTCSACGASIRSGQGYVINADLSERFAATLGQVGQARQALEQFGAQVAGAQTAQVIACSDNCAGRAVGSEKELELAKKAAAVWWAHRHIGQDVYVTKAMLTSGNAGGRATTGGRTARTSPTSAPMNPNPTQSQPSSGHRPWWKFW